MHRESGYSPRLKAARYCSKNYVLSCFLPSRSLTYTVRASRLLRHKGTVVEVQQYAQSAGRGLNTAPCGGDPAYTATVGYTVA
jgi:hypothetical protein